MKQTYECKKFGAKQVRQKRTQLKNVMN